VCCGFSFSQTYGLRFLSHEVVKEKRTSLNLTPSGDICFKNEVDISFSLSFVPNMETYFGYVFRLITDNENIDLVYDQRAARFNCVIGEKLVGTFAIDSLQLYKNWNQISLKIKQGEQSISFYQGEKLVCTAKAKLSGCFKLYFGTNDFDEFQTADIPPMNIKDIRIKEENNRGYYWPLNETTGSKATDRNNNTTAQISNAVWINELHQRWQLNNSLHIHGSPSVAFDKKSNTLYITSQDSLYRVDIKTGRLNGDALAQKLDTIPPGNQAVFDNGAGKLYCFYIDQKKVAQFDFNTRKWNTGFAVCPLTEFWQANKFISPLDSSLYIVGGYGQLNYKNEVQRYNLVTHTWDKVKASGDFFAPRYLAALGTTANSDTAYILGGYGSTTGNQVLNPKYYYDLYAYDVKTHYFKNIYHLKEPLNQFCFANSMIVNSQEDAYYALTYANSKFNSSLQLIKGSLSKPEYTLLGDSIPYSFYDVGSFSDLFYSDAYKKLIAVTLYTSRDGSTAVQVYTIGFPPNTLLQVEPVTGSNYKYLIIVALLAVVITGILLFYFKRKGVKQIAVQSNRFVNTEINPVSGPAKEIIVSDEKQEDALPQEKKSKICLFGQLEITAKEGDDLTKLFTPLLKEMFLLIAIHTLKYKTGVSSSKLYATLWAGKSNKDAQNNRSVNMVKLKSIIDKLGSINIIKDGDRWTLQYDENDIYIDLAEFMHIIEEEHINADIFKLLVILKKGSFLSGTEYEWLDDIKADIAGKIIDTLHHSVNDHQADYELLIEVANSIFFFDPVNEEALHIKCRSLNLLGRHSLAKTTYNKFLKDYYQMYGEDYKESFNEVIA
jgi:two-component SAPR family response regulator